MVESIWEKKIKGLIWISTIIETKNTIKDKI